MCEPSPANAADVAKRLAELLDARKQEYALGGAIALGYWGVPRGTVDVDVTIYLAPDQPSECVWLLQEIGCEFSSASATESLREHGFCRVAFAGTRVDVFLPTVPFYAAAKDLADAEQVLRAQGRDLDRAWIREQLVSMYGARDPRLAAWDDLTQDVPPI